LKKSKQKSSNAETMSSAAPVVKKIKDIDLKFSDVPLDYEGFCSWRLLLWLFLVGFRLYGTVNFVMDILVIRALEQDPLVSRTNFFVFCFFAAADMLLFLWEFAVGARALLRGKIHAIFFDRVASSLSKLSFSRYSILSTKLKGNLSIKERVAFFALERATILDVFVFFLITIPLTVTLIVIVISREVARSESGAAINAGDVIEIVIKFVFLFVEAAIMGVAILLWPCARFAIAKKPLEKWAKKQIKKRLHALYPDVIGALSGRAPGAPKTADDEFSESEDLLETARSNRAVAKALDATSDATDDLKAKADAKDAAVREAVNKTAALTQEKANDAAKAAQDKANEASKKAQTQVDALMNLGKTKFRL
jgi:hypothetical protein